MKLKFEVFFSCHGRARNSQAAMIAAYNSKARTSAQVPVDYTFAKHLKKPVGAKPGKVIYHVYNTLTINPNREQTEALRVE